jgi:hypothetical protein
MIRSWAAALLGLWPALAEAQSGGVRPDWEIRELAAKLEKNAGTIEGLLGQLKPEEWVSQGAPGAYIDQVKQTRQFNSFLILQAQALGREPAKLSVALDTFLRLDHLQSMLESVTGGVRSYQNASLAELLATTVGQNLAAREQLKEYARELAVEREKEWEIANQEAQRCRAALSKKPPAPAPKKPVPAKP